MRFRLRFKALYPRSLESLTYDDDLLTIFRTGKWPAVDAPYKMLEKREATKRYKIDRRFHNLSSCILHE